MRQISQMMRGCACLIAVMAPLAAFGAEQDACSGFRWPVETELAWMTAADTLPLETGAEIATPPLKAVSLKLKPASTAALPVKPSAKPHEAAAPDSFSGWFRIANLPKEGVYQVTLSHHAWIDTIQDAAPVATAGFTGKPACQAIRKSVRFQLGQGPVLVEISGSPVDTIKVAVREAN